MPALFLWNLRTDISDSFLDIVPKEISSDNKEKEAFRETSLCSVKSSHRVTAFPSRSLSLSLFLWNLQSDILKPIEGSGEKGIILLMKSGKTLSEKLLSVLLIHVTELQLSPQEAAR